jgi:hypothetical protein
MGAEDFDDLMLDSIYETLGTDVEVVPVEGTSDSAIALRVIDKSAGVLLSDDGQAIGRGGPHAQLGTMVPMMAVKSQSLIAASLSPGDLVGHLVEMSGAWWTITNHLPRPGIAGEPKGQVYYQLREANGPS